jgi:hypothetical protein
LLPWGMLLFFYTMWWLSQIFTFFLGLVACNW